MFRSGRWTRSIVVVGAIAAAVYLLPDMARQVAYAVAKGQLEADRSQLAELAKQDMISPLFRTVAKICMPAVVEVRVAKKMQVESVDPEEYFKRFFGEDFSRGRVPRNEIPKPKLREYFSRGLGSGVIVDAEKGHILTNYHVVDGADQVEIVLADQRKLKAEWIRSDPQTDLAIIKVSPDRLVSVPLGDSDKMQVGDLVLAIGAPEGLPQTVTKGIISALSRTTGNPEMYQNFLQTDAAINHGNSGGPLVNMHGEVIGINTAIVSRTGVNEGIGFAIPSNMARQVMTELIEKGKVTRGFLGVRIQKIDEKLAKDMGIPSTEGALVLEVVPASPADKAGLKVDDFITTINGKTISSGNDVRNAIAAVSPGKAAEIEIVREGKKQTIKVIVAAQPDDMNKTFSGEEGGKEEAQSGRYGLEVATLTDELAKENGYKPGTKGVLITDVKEGSDAADKGLAPGMLITQVGGKTVTNVQEFKDAVAEKGKDGLRLRATDPKGTPLLVYIEPDNSKKSSDKSATDTDKPRKKSKKQQ